jgi:hypothetical protein
MSLSSDGSADEEKVHLDITTLAPLLPKAVKACSGVKGKSGAHFSHERLRGSRFRS